MQVSVLIAEVIGRLLPSGLVFQARSARTSPGQAETGLPDDFRCRDGEGREASEGRDWLQFPGPADRHSSSVVPGAQSAGVGQPCVQGRVVRFRLQCEIEVVQRNCAWSENRSGFPPQARMARTDPAQRRRDFFETACRRTKHGMRGRDKVWSLLRRWRHGEVETELRNCHGIAAGNGCVLPGCPTSHRRPRVTGESAGMPPIMVAVMVLDEEWATGFSRR